MADVFPEYIGYDRTIAVFSPDGRLFQVEYAKEAVKKGGTAVGITFKDGVVLASVKPNLPLLVSESAEKIFQIDDHAGAVAAGLLADARLLISQARVRAQIHRLTYDEPMSIWEIARVVGDRMQLSTMYAGLRPFGVSLLIAGTDKKGPHLVESDPSGMLYEWRATGIGKGEELSKKILQQKWNPNLKEKDAIKLAIDVIKKIDKATEENIEIAVIKDMKFKRFLASEIKL